MKKPVTTPQGGHKFLNIIDVIERTSLSRAAIYRLTAEGLFPRAVPLTIRRKGWVEADIAAWISSKIEDAA